MSTTKRLWLEVHQWPNGTKEVPSYRSNQNERFSLKGGIYFPKLFQFDRANPFSFESKFPSILVEAHNHNSLILALKKRPCRQTSQRQREVILTARSYLTSLMNASLLREFLRHDAIYGKCSLEYLKPSPWSRLARNKRKNCKHS